MKKLSTQCILYTEDNKGFSKMMPLSTPKPSITKVNLTSVVETGIELDDRFFVIDIAGRTALFRM